MAGVTLSEEDERILCAKFLDLARSGERGQAFRSCLEELFPVLKPRIMRICTSWGPLQDAAVEPEDIVHEVLSRLQGSPPTHEPRCNARVTVLKWIKTTSARILLDLKQGRESGSHGGRVQEPGLNGPGTRRAVEITSEPSAEDPETNAQERQLVERFMEFLRSSYPKGAWYLETRRAHPQASSNELAALMGISRANLDQIVSRTRRQAVRFNRMTSS